MLRLLKSNDDFISSSDILKDLGFRSINDAIENEVYYSVDNYDSYLSGTKKEILDLFLKYSDFKGAFVMALPASRYETFISEVLKVKPHELNGIKTFKNLEKYNKLQKDPNFPYNVVLEKSGIYLDDDYVECIGKDLIEDNSLSDKELCNSVKDAFPSTSFKPNCQDCLKCYLEISNKLSNDSKKL